MRSRVLWVVVALCLVVALLLGIKKHKSATATGEVSPVHGIKCLMADGQTPCGSHEVSDLNDDIAGLKKLVGVAKSAAGAAKSVAGAAKTVAGAAKGAIGDAQQAGSDAKQLGSDAKQLGSDAKNKNISQGVGDAQQAGSDAKTSTGDTKQLGGDAQQVTQALKGIGNLTLQSPDGTLGCVQTNGSACSSDQIRALQTHAAQKLPPLTIQGEVEQSSN